jgi:signal transduction histidine kinase
MNDVPHKQKETEVVDTDYRQLMARALAHELAGSLAGIMGVSQLLSRKLEPGSPAHSKAGQIFAAVARCSALPAQLASLSVAPTDTPSPVDLNRTVGDAFALIQQAAGHSIEVTGKYVGACWALAPPNRLAPAISLLCVLCRRTLPEGGRLHIATQLDASGNAVISMTCRGDRVVYPVPIEGSSDPEQDLVSAALRRLAGTIGGRFDCRQDGAGSVVIGMVFRGSPTQRRG